MVPGFNLFRAMYVVESQHLLSFVFGRLGYFVFGANNYCLLYVCLVSDFSLSGVCLLAVSLWLEAFSFLCGVICGSCVLVYACLCALSACCLLGCSWCLLAFAWCLPDRCPCLLGVCLCLLASACRLPCALSPSAPTTTVPSSMCFAFNKLPSGSLRISSARKQ